MSVFDFSGALATSASGLEPNCRCLPYFGAVERWRRSRKVELEAGHRLVAGHQSAQLERGESGEKAMSSDIGESNRNDAESCVTALSPSKGVGLSC